MRRVVAYQRSPDEFHDECHDVDVIDHVNRDGPHHPAHDRAEQHHSADHDGPNDNGSRAAYYEFDRVGSER